MALSSLIVLKKKKPLKSHSWFFHVLESEFALLSSFCSVVLMKNDGKNAGDRASLRSNLSNLGMIYVILTS